MKHNNSIVHTIVIKLLFIVGLSVCIVTTVFSNTTKQLEDIQTPQKSFSPLLAVKTNLIYWVGIMPDFKHYSWMPNLSLEYFLPTDGRLTLLEHTPKGRSVEISISEFRPGALNPVSG